MNKNEIPKSAELTADEIKIKGQEVAENLNLKFGDMLKSPDGKTFYCFTDNKTESDIIVETLDEKIIKQIVIERHEEYVIGDKIAKDLKIKFIGVQESFGGKKIYLFDDLETKNNFGVSSLDKNAVKQALINKLKEVEEVAHKANE